MKQSGIEIDDSVSVHDGGILKAMPATKRATFKEMFIKYCKIMESGQYSLIENEELVEIRTQRPLVIDAYNKLGPEKVKAMKYHISNIRDAITQMTNTKEDYKIVEMIKRSLPMMQWIPVKKAKEALEKVYRLLGKNGKVTANDIGKWFEIELALKYLDGKSQRSILIKRPKLMRVFGEPVGSSQE